MKQISINQKERVEELVLTLRDHEGWRSNTFREMKCTILNEEQALVFLGHYKFFVKNFFLYMLRVVSSAPQQDEQFQKLVPNIWDELGAEKLSLIHI